MDGLVFSNHTPTPGLVEYKKAIEPVQVLGGSATAVEIINRYDFVTLDHLKCEWSIVGDGFTRPGGELAIPKGILPGQTAQLIVSGVPQDLPGEAYLQVVFTMKEPTLWAKADHEIAAGEIPLKPAPKFAELASKSATAPKLAQISPTILSIAGSTSTWQFDVVAGTLASWTKGATEIIQSPPKMDFYRALTDNDKGHEARSGSTQWKDKFLHLTKPHVRSVTWTSTAENVTVVVETRIAPPVLEWAIDTKTTYTFTGENVSIHVVGKPQGVSLPSNLARIGLTMSLDKSVSDVQWFGRGPGESYRDKKLSQRFGTWKAPVDALFTNYEFPQESGNRTDVRWVAFLGADGGRKMTASFADQHECSFTALHYAAQDLDECTHPYELQKRKKDEVVVRLDWVHHGLGTASCGPGTREEFSLKTAPFVFDLLLE